MLPLPSDSGGVTGGWVSDVADGIRASPLRSASGSAAAPRLSLRAKRSNLVEADAMRPEIATALRAPQ